MPTPIATKPLSGTSLYLRVMLFSIVVFGAGYAYTAWLGTPSVLNKTAADTSIIVMGLSMLLSSICYFWNSFDSLIRYRKHLGLVGFAFACAHMVLSFPAFQALFRPEVWQKGLMWPALTGTLAMVIFTVMALVSNTKMAMLLGGKTWRRILRTGYVAVLFVLAHVVILKSARWITWYENGMQTAPALSLLVSGFMVVVILMRIALWLATRNKTR